LSKIPNFETNHSKIKESFDLISPKEKKLINVFAFNSEFFSNNGSVLSSSNQEFFKTPKETPMVFSKSKLLSLMPTRTDVRKF